MTPPGKFSILVWLTAAAAVHGLGSGGGAQDQRRTPPRIAPCPDSPNCVSSLSSDPRHAVEPIAFSGPASEARRKLLGVVRSMPRAEIVQEEGGYLHVAFRSALFRFVDDAEFLIDEARSLIQVRSASRAGYWDLGVNRRRIEEIRRLLAIAAPPEAEP
jgi:uncharacterized protein (DUF1499 family)